HRDLGGKGQHRGRGITLEKFVYILASVTAGEEALGCERVILGGKALPETIHSGAVFAAGNGGKLTAFPHKIGSGGSVFLVGKALAAQELAVFHGQLPQSISAGRIIALTGEKSFSGFGVEGKTEILQNGGRSLTAGSQRKFHQFS